MDIALTTRERLSIRKRFRNFLTRIQDAKIANVEGYSRGVDTATQGLTKKINSLTARLGELTQENLNMEDKLRRLYDERISIVESRNLEKCENCMKYTEEERERLRRNQSLILDLIQNFNIVFMKVFKHASFVADEHDTILKSSSRIKASRDTLMVIKSEADEIIKKVLPLTSIVISEDPRSQMESIVKQTEKDTKK